MDVQTGIAPPTDRPRPTPSRSRTWLVAAVVVGAVAAGGVSGLTRGAGATPSTWEDLADPGRGAVGTGPTLGQGGGDDSRSVYLSGLHITRVVIDVRCEGAGSVTFRGAGQDLGGGECFAGQPVGFALTSGPLAPITRVEVTSGPGVVWRAYVSAG